MDAERKEQRACKRESSNRILGDESTANQIEVHDAWLLKAVKQVVHASIGYQVTPREVQNLELVSASRQMPQPAVADFVALCNDKLFQAGTTRSNCGEHRVITQQDTGKVERHEVLASVQQRVHGE